MDNIDNGFVVVPIDKGTGNIALVYKRFYVSIIIRELGLNNNSSTYPYSNGVGLSANDINDKNIRNLKIKFGVDNIPIEIIYCLICIGCLRWIKKPVKTRFIIESPKSSIIPLVRTITSIFRLFFRQIK